MKSFILKLFSGILIRSLRITYTGAALRDNKAIFIFWHGKMLLGWWLFRYQNPGAMISKSKDGELLSKLLLSWGYRLYRGSSSSDGKLALEEIVNDISIIDKIVITPDGPRGPTKQIKNGVLSIALKTGIPIIPVKINFHSKITLSSWDGFEIPYPFSDCDVAFGEPVYYKEYVSGEKLSSFKKMLEDKM